MSIIKTSLENTCKDPDLVYSIRFAVKHVHDVSYAGSLFANYYTLWLLKLGKELPIISHDLYYNMFATIAGTGNSDELLKAAFKQFKDGSLMRKDEYYLGKITVAERKAVAQHVYNQVAEISTETSKWPSLVKDDEILKKAAKRIITSLCFGPGPITDVELNATPHLYIPWMYTILQRLEQNIFIQEEQPQDHVSAAYVHRNVHELIDTSKLSKKLIASLKHAVHSAISIENMTFRPLKYTDPRGCRRFSILPIYSFQCRHVTVDRQALGKLLRDAGTSPQHSVLSPEEARRIYFDMFWMKKIGYSTIESLSTENSVFWDIIRTDGVDLEFVFKRPKREPSKKRFTPADLQQLAAGGATIWGVDPGLMDTFVAVDGCGKEVHRVRKTSTLEYYSVCGYTHAARKRTSYAKTDPQAKEIIDRIPTMKSADIKNTIISLRYRFRHHQQITRFYDIENRFAKLKLKTCMQKQKGVTEIAKRLLTGRKKYSVGTVDSNETGGGSKGKVKWKKNSSKDQDKEADKPVQIAFGNCAMSCSLRGKLPLSARTIRNRLCELCKQRKSPARVVMIDEYLTSQICPLCNRRDLKNSKNDQTPKAMLV
ncbi:hypothetical protein DFQ30_003588 [Apophysomyces sp. BC1015]|nr:hypothetical protein DFQ30_003588 [Apophysomyces sp. BC1015]